YIFENLPKYDSNGNEIAYTVTEEETGNIFYTQENTEITGDQLQGYTIENTFEVPDERISIAITKEWVDTEEQKEKRPEEITLILTGNGQKYEQKITKENVDVENANEWK